MAEEKRRRGRRILIGIGVMILVAAAPFVILSRFAGGWGVPYFSFTTERGTTCTNDFTGYHCDDLTLADIEWWGDVNFPEGTKLLGSHYKSTNDFVLDARVEVPGSRQRWTNLELKKVFGSCDVDHPIPIDVSQLEHVCVRANDEAEAIDSTGPMADTLYQVTTGYRRTTHELVVNVHEESR